MALSPGSNRDPFNNNANISAEDSRKEAAKALDDLFNRMVEEAQQEDDEIEVTLPDADDVPVSQSSVIDLSTPFQDVDLIGSNEMNAIHQNTNLSVSSSRPSSPMPHLPLSTATLPFLSSTPLSPPLMVHRYPPPDGARKASLYRLLVSSHFTPFLALTYLSKYTFLEEPSVHELICQRLEQQQQFQPLIHSIHDYLPQFIQFLFQSPILEQCLLEMAKKDFHLALQLLWWMEGIYQERNAVMKPPTPSSTAATSSSQSNVTSSTTANNPIDWMKLLRFIGKCQLIVFDSTPDKILSPSTPLTPSASTPVGPFKKWFTKLAFPNTKSALIGMGAVMVGMTCPAMNVPMQKLSYSYAIARNENNEIAPQKVYPSSQTQANHAVHRGSISVPINKNIQRLKMRSPSLEDLHRGQAFKSSSMTNVHTHHSSSSVGEVRRNSDGIVPVTLPRLVTNSLSSNSMTTPHRSYQTYQFLTALVSIAQRLLSLPSKESRQQGLVAELTLLNHNLPADICLPFYCQDTGSHLHHKIVRCVADEAVVLNSADRCPFMVLIETLDESERLDDSLPSLKGFEIENSDGTPDTKSDTATDTNVNNTSDSNTNKENTIASTLPEPVHHPMSEKLKTAAILLAQLNSSDPMTESIRQKIISEMMKESIPLQTELLREDPSAITMQEDWLLKCARIRRHSPYGKYRTWQCFNCIVKSNADLRQEHLALQFIRELNKLFQASSCRAFVRPYALWVMNQSGGLMETVVDSISIHSLKKTRLCQGLEPTLSAVFKERYTTEESMREAQRAFSDSLTGYCLVSYLLVLRDRHNGNILLDKYGHLIHIDFGFMLTCSPGGVAVEQAPFKLISDYLQVLGGVSSGLVEEWKSSMIETFLVIRKHADALILLVDLMKDCKMPCFQAGGLIAVQQLRDRFLLHLSDVEVAQALEKMIVTSLDSSYTKVYDTFQYYSNGIL